MNANLTYYGRIFFSVLFFIVITGNVFSQGPNDYNLCVRNLHQTSSNVFEMDIWLEWTGTNTQKFQFFQGGLNFNYTGWSNGGIITGAFVPGSADPSLTPVQRSPNWNINQTSKQIRFISAIGTPSTICPVTPPPPGFRLGTFRMTNTVSFASSSQPNFAWSYATGTSTTTQTKEAFYLNGSATGTGFLDVSPFPNHCLINTYICGAPCPVADAGGPYITCGDIHLNGTINFATIGTWTSSGSGTFDPNVNDLNAIYHPSPADLANGSVLITLSTNSIGPPCPCPPSISSKLINFTNVDDNNLCTTDGCNQSTGMVTHDAVNVEDNNVCTTDGCDSTTGISHTTINADDNNLCTLDGCDSVTGVFHSVVNVDDNNVCTLDGCDSSTGVFHTVVNVDDNNVCTVDGCDSSTGVFHTVENIDDNNACTLDGCDSVTGVFHSVINVDDNNVCTLDGCDSSTGVFHTVENIDDNNACTLDGCNPSTGIFHIPVNIDDDNACTTDFCDSISGLISHVAVNTDDNNGCTTDACDPLTGVISHADVVILLNVSVDPILCYGSTTCLFLSASGGTPPYSGIGMLCGYSAGNFEIVVTDANGCVATSSGFIDQPSKLIVNITSTQSNCSGNSGTATAYPSGGTPPYSYLWLPGGQTTQTATGLTAGNNSLTVTDANNCNVTTNFVITINNPPLGVITGPSGACAKQSGQVYCITPSNPYAASYVWTLPMGVSVQGAANGSCITLKFSTKFKGGFICAKAVTPCGISANVCLNVLLITTKPVTPGIITGPSSLCPNATATYSIVAIPNATSYTWSFSGNLQILSGQGTTSIVAKALSNWNGGSVKVKAINCKDHSGTKSLNVAKSSVCKLSVQSISTKTLFTGNKFSVYPNPTSGKFKISFEAKSKSTYTLKVIDLLGNLIKSDFISSKEGLNTKDFDLNFVSKGMYFITLENEDLSIQSLRIVVD